MRLRSLVWKVDVMLLRMMKQGVAAVGKPCVFVNQPPHNTTNC